MDINEVSNKKIHRHPWELSRTRCLMEEWKPYFDAIGEKADYIDIGAGDMFFDKYLMHHYKSYTLKAVDIGYGTDKVDLVKHSSKRVQLFTDLKEIGECHADFALMLDSLEYMPDEADYIFQLSEKVRRGGYLFFAMPAYQFLFSQHDVNVKTLRRYSKKEFEEIIDHVPGVSIVKERYFYSSLFFVRLMQKYLVRDIDPEKKVTTAWKWKANSVPTKMVTEALNMDYDFNKAISKIGLSLPGLSLMAVCKKED